MKKMKLRFPFKEFTNEQIMSAHGDERGQMMSSNDSLTSTNLSIIFIAVVFVGFIIYAIYNLLT